MLGGLLYLIGTLISTTIFTGSISPTLTGRIIYGVGIAFSMNAAPTYIAEIAPPSIRGRLVSLKEGFIVGGILLGFATSAFEEARVINANELSDFRHMWLPIPLLLSLVLLVGMWRMPPSPRWLLLRAAAARGTMKHHETAASSRTAALAALSRFRKGASSAELEREIHEIEDALQSEKKGGGGGGGSDAEDAMLREAGGGGTKASSSDWWKARHALLVGVGLVALQQLTGQPSVLYYQEAIFRDAGFGAMAASASVIVGAAKLLATLTTVASVDRFGRRPLLMIGVAMMLAALLVLSVAFRVGKSAGGSVVVLALVTFVCGYQVGFGPVTWLLISEIFPLRLRTTALSLAVVANFGLNLLVAITLEPLQAAVGQAYLFLLYAALCVVSLVFIARVVPETKGKSLEEIEGMLRGR